MPAKKTSDAPPAAIAAYNALIASNPKIERKGATMPYTSVGGNMFSLLDPSGRLTLRLLEKDREAFRKKYKTGDVIQYGALMKEYVEVPDSLLKNTKEAKKYLDMSFEYARSLKPKAAKKSSLKK
jgi:hypothetical protein